MLLSALAMVGVIFLLLLLCGWLFGDDPDREAKERSRFHLDANRQRKQVQDEIRRANS